MLKSTFLRPAFLSLALIGLANAEGPAWSGAVTQPRETVIFDYSTVFPETDTSTPTFNLAVLAEIANWLSENFNLPLIQDLPSMKLASPSQMVALLNHGNNSPQTQPPATRTLEDSEIVAVYEHTTKTIYLPQGWTGTTPAELSVLVHEMVHHMQQEAGFKYNCPQERERLAYDAQESWLNQSGLTLEGEFGLDPFTRLVRMNCI
jgi:hypothetical protein